MSERTDNERYRFADFEFHAGSGELRRNGVRIPLRPQPATVLAILLEHSGRLVERETLQEALWGETAVDAEAGLNHCVRQVRAALGERAAEDGYLQTEPRRGYRFVGDVTVVSPVQAAPSSSARRWVLAAATLAAVAGAVGLLWGGSGLDAPHPAASSSEFRQARWLLEEGGPGAARRAIPMFERLVREAPDFGPGHAGLARALAFADTRSDLAPIRRHVARARSLAPDSAEVLVMVAFLETFDRHDYAAAERTLRAAIRVSPTWVTPRHHLAALQSIVGRDEDALSTMHAALALDPVSPLLAGDLAWFYFVAGRWDEAVAWADRTLELDPGWSPARSIGFHARLRGADPEARRQRVLEALERHEAPEAIVAESRNGDALEVYWRWRAAALAGYPDAHLPRAMAWAALDEPELAFRELHDAREAGDRGLLMLIRDPRLAGLRGFDGFDRLLEHFELPGGARDAS